MPLSCVQTVPPLEIVDSIEFVYVPLFRNPSFLQQKYVVEGLSLTQISEQISSSKEAVRKGLERCGIPVREAHKPHGRPSQLRFDQKFRRGRVDIHKVEQRLIDAARDLQTQGLSLRQIAQTMTRLKIPTKCNGQAWHPQMVKRILGSGGR